MSKKINLSVTLATFNEEENIGRCLESVKDFVDEIVVVDGGSTDMTVEVAKRYGAKVVVTENPRMFHINKNKANELAKGVWILQLDADEVVSPELGEEIRIVMIRNPKSEIRNSKQVQNSNFKFQNDKENLFLRHQGAVEARHGKIGTDEGNVVAYFIPRRNYFLGKFLKYGGTYPDGAIRLFKKGYARLPEKDLHEIYEIKGKVKWLNAPLFHFDSPTFERYLERNNRYSSRFAQELKDANVPLNFLNYTNYMFVKPVWLFLKIYFRHKGFCDGFPGLVWAMYSALTWRAAWVKYWEKKRFN